MDFNTTEKEKKAEYRRQLALVRDSAPDVWSQLLEAGICPYLFGLSVDCGSEKSCKHCWEQALALDFCDDVKRTIIGQYYCAKDNHFLKLIEGSGTNVSVFYICPCCHTKFEMIYDEKKCVQKIINRGKDSNQAPSGSNNPDDPSYNEE